MSEARMTSPAPRMAIDSSNTAATRSNRSQTVQLSNMLAAKAVADSVRTSLGPRGMDKMISSSKGDVLITNDGATILQEMKVAHPCAKMLQDLSKAQDVEVGDGTTSVVIIAGALIEAAMKLLNKGLPAGQISRSFGIAAENAEKILQQMAVQLDLSDREVLLKNCMTSLSSKMVSANAPLLAQIAVDAVLRVIDPAIATSVDLRNIRIVKRLGGSIEDSELVDGLVFNEKATHTAQGPTRIENAKIGLIQFQISPPKTDLECNVVVKNFAEIDRTLKEERQYILNICKEIQRAGINVLLIQKSILRDAVNDLALHFLAKMKIMVIKDVERDEVEFLCRTLGCLPIASVDALKGARLGEAALCEEVHTPSGKLVKVTGIKQPGKTVTILVRGANKLILDETERCLHDALCVVRSLVKRKFVIPGGGAPEIEVSLQLQQLARGMQGVESYGVRAYGEALEIIPITLAENAGLNPIATLTDLRNRHSLGERHTGLNTKKNAITNMIEADVVQPLLVTVSAINLATETVRMILKIDDIVATR